LHYCNDGIGRIAAGTADSDGLAVEVDVFQIGPGETMISSPLLAALIAACMDV